MSGKIPDPRVPRSMRDRSWSFEGDVVTAELEKERATEKEKEKEKEKEGDSKKSHHFKPTSMMDIHPVELARQLTLYSDSLYRAITPDEFMKTAFTERRDEHLLAFSNRYTKVPPPLPSSSSHNQSDQWCFMKVSNWCASELLAQPNINKRVAVMRRFISIAEVIYSKFIFYLI